MKLEFIVGLASCIQELSESVIFSKDESKVKVTSHVFFQKNRKMQQGGVSCEISLNWEFQ